ASTLMVHLVAGSYASALIRPAAETQFMQEPKRLIHADAVHIVHANGRGVARADQTNDSDALRMPQQAFRIVPIGLGSWGMPTSEDTIKAGVPGTAGARDRLKGLAFKVGKVDPEHS